MYALFIYSIVIITKHISSLVYCVIAREKTNHILLVSNVKLIHI